MITFCIPSKDNLRYLKHSINSILKNQEYDNEIVVYVDSSNDGTLEWLIEHDIRYIENTDDIPKGIAYGYNRCIEAATNCVVCMFHADMYMGKGFDVEILQHVKCGAVVSATRIEPPLHPKGLDKIVENFGMYPEDFDVDGFDAKVEECRTSFSDKVTRGIFAPWACFKKDILKIGMHDENFHSYHEDTDIFNRFILNGMDINQTWSAVVYHFTCRGGQFQDGVEAVTTNESFHNMKNRSMLEFVRKWGTFIHNDEFGYPIVYGLYNIGFDIDFDVDDETSYNLLRFLEPWCSRVVCNKNNVIVKFINDIQPNTSVNLSDKITTDNSDVDVLLKFKASEFIKSQHVNTKVIQQLPLILADSGEVGEMEFGCFSIHIRNLTTYEKNLIPNEN